MDYLVKTPIEYLKGVGAERGAALREEAGVDTMWDLLNYFPFRYVDRSKYDKIKEIPGILNRSVQLKGTISGLTEVGHGRAKRLTAKFQDDSGVIDLVWFQGGKWIKNKLKSGVLYRVYGRPKVFGKSVNITHPEIVPFQQVAHEKGLQPVYNSTDKLSKKGLNARGIERLTYELSSTIKGKIPEILPSWILEQYRLVSRETAYYNMHIPPSEKAIQQAQFRLKFEELLFLQLELLLKKGKSKEKSPGYVFEKTGSFFDDFYQSYIPFELTGAQKRVVKEIRADLRSGKHMNRLLQGDVGSGKTLVALLSMLFAIGNDFQAALMAPTEILAQQHFETITELLEPLGINVVLLTGSTKKKERVVIHEGLQDGSNHIIIGTHALLEPVVKFKNLGFVVIDEQHRFGVAQRARLWKKNERPPHVLVMTATPIPRTLAMTFYGDLDVSVIDELPPGRKPVTTKHFYESSRLKAFQLIKEEIAKGRQVYIVYPLIEESETLDYNNLMEGYEAISKIFPRPDYQVSIVHGRMKPADKEFEMQRFAKGNTQIMVATTVIEVGVNVPNATVMMIESSEKFGLSQLHQLRGRVGRGADQSFCILMTGNKVSKEGKKRLQTMVETNDGFKIAEVDLEIRGPGDIMGTQQSGILNLRLADLARDGQIVSIARQAAQRLIQDDPTFVKEEHVNLRMELKRMLKSKPNWSKIS
jgi:ATP-dependent DNA helicase RecG